MLCPMQEAKRAQIIGETSRMSPDCPRSSTIFTQNILVDRELVDALLGELKSSEEDGVHNARATHGNTEACSCVNGER